MVVKLGGAALDSDEALNFLARDLAVLHLVGMRPVVVHGGGKSVGALSQRLGLEPRFRDGLRITDSETMEVVEMVLAGSLNKRIAGCINQFGGSAVGISGVDGSLLRARRLSEELGQVGEVASVRTGLIEDLCRDGHIPVIAPVARTDDGAACNINADEVAASLAAALGAGKLFLVSNVDGVLDAEGALVSQLDAEGTRTLIEEGAIAGGMLPKVRCALKALDAGVEAVHILNGLHEHAVLLELLTHRGIGTLITRSGRGQP
ncbi:MAG: acetylglutamate kinase [Gammaproteobacteria bacterium AqS3]|nr:acetylglutamate kinase [Gammaproteobacteria bacterium AqS3]